MKTISYKGKLADDSIDTVALHTIKGKIGYRIIKMQLMPETIGNLNGEHVVQVYSVRQTATSNSIDFTDNTLLAAGVVNNEGSVNRYPPNDAVVFDNTIFNQDIYVTHKNSTGGSGACNYYIELEQIALSDLEATMATLKDIRAIES